MVCKELKKGLHILCKVDEKTFKVFDSITDACEIMRVYPAELIDILDGKTEQYPDMSFTCVNDEMNECEPQYCYVSVGNELNIEECEISEAEDIVWIGLNKEQYDHLHRLSRENGMAPLQYMKSKLRV